MINYSYRPSGWRDILTNVGGVSYSSDAIGNRTQDGVWNYSWEHGMQLSSMSARSGAVSIGYAYGADGLRLSKTVTSGGTSTEYDYYYRDGRLICQRWNGNDLYMMMVEIYLFGIGLKSA
ncbi:MAG: hypothetical protein IJS22_00770 [Lachnospiraceae bacterium]|nr:hypothetical protein [Lachnospiraceae bacterium]